MADLRRGLQAGKDDLVASLWLGLVGLGLWAVFALLSSEVGGWALYTAFVALAVGLTVAVVLAVRRPARRKSGGR